MSGGLGWEQWRALLEGRPLPAAIVDVAAMARNLERIGAIVARARTGSPAPTVRIASKSLRHLGLLRRLSERGRDVIRGVMPFTAAECSLLVDHGFTDLLLGYPIGRPGDAAIVCDLVARGAQVRCVVDHPEQVDLLSLAARERGVVLPVCIDVDCSVRLAGLHLGVRRSPVRTAQEAVALAKWIGAAGGLRLVGILAYEAQIAGLSDRGAAKRLVKGLSRPVVLRRRAKIVEELARAGFPLEIVNGGGTGSAAFTAADPTVTEITVGSGFLCSHLFDGYGGLPIEPALWFALPVVRRSDPGFVTCAGGGYVASGAPGADRLPVVVAPAGLSPLGLEGYGEVQTPFRWRGAGPGPAIGDPVVCRPAKAGEIAERFASYLLIRGEEVVGEEPTYRGLGACFP
jgi:D-serine deaminase-like pyridoxal phosphate-dependent protein